MKRGPLLIREWNAEEFHRRVLELESNGYVARRDTYRITAEMNPDTGEVIHLYTIEMSAGSTEAVTGATEDTSASSDHLSAPGGEATETSEDK